MLIQKESENALVEKLKNNSKSAFSAIFLTYYQDLVRFAFRFTKNLDLSEEIVQDVFIKIWEERSTLEFHHSLKSFLLKSVQNLSIDRLRHLNIVNKYASLVLDNPILSENATENYVLRDELELNYIRAMEKIPIEKTWRFCSNCRSSDWKSVMPVTRRVKRLPDYNHHFFSASELRSILPRFTS